MVDLRLGRWLLLGGVIIGGLACTAPAPTFTAEQRQATATAIAFATAHPICDTADGRQSIERLKRSEAEWRDALTLAESTPRIALAPQIAELQRIRREVQATVPTCATEAQRYLTLAVDFSLEGLTAFLAQSNQTDLALAVAQSRQRLTDFTLEMQRIQP